MHNLLLGLLKWHCKRFWLMSDADDEKEPAGVSKKEQEDVKSAAKEPLPNDLPSALPHLSASKGKAKAARVIQKGKNASDEGETTEATAVPFIDLLLGSSTDSSDTDFVPQVASAEWGGDWVPPAEGKIIFDHDALLYINSLLPKLQIPTWIKRAIPVLGKASFGRLKADEWRNLFTIQLPLILPPYWNDQDPVSQSLLHNFADLVSLVNLALKRTMNADRVEQYLHHTRRYIESSILLFPEITLAPNHHMAFHIAKGLQGFGPCRAWWSFSMERLMSQVLKSTGNNRLGKCFPVNWHILGAH
jgi:hypothetical protein